MTAGSDFLGELSAGEVSGVLAPGFDASAGEAAGFAVSAFWRAFIAFLAGLASLMITSLSQLDSIRRYSSRLSEVPSSFVNFGCQR